MKLRSRLVPVGMLTGCAALVVGILIGLPFPSRDRGVNPASRSAPWQPVNLNQRDETAGVFVVGVEGDGLRVIAAPGEFQRAAHPAWSPDGRSIAFTAFDPTGRSPSIRIVTVEGGPSEEVASGVAPSWSHDGSKLAYMVSGRPAIATDWSRPGRNSERIELLHLSGPREGETETLVEGIWPCWSPIDDRLAFVARRGATWDVYVRSANGLSQSRLTDDPALDTDPMWSADGQAIIFLSNRGVRWDLYRIAADGQGVAERLTNYPSREDRASISPDSQFVAFADNAGRPNSRILVLDLARETARPLLATSYGENDPAWSPDGRFIAFTSRRPAVAP